MPNIKIDLTDNTGAEYTGDEQVIFFPGLARIADGKADENRCVYISTSDYANVADILVIPGKEDEAGFQEKQLCYAMVCGYLQAGYDVLYYNPADNSDGSRGKLASSKLNFLLDKDAYNVKFLTAGTHGTMRAEHRALMGGSSLRFIFNVDCAEHNALTGIAAARRDCMVIGSVEYDTAALANNDQTDSPILKGDVLADAIKAAIENTATKEKPYSIKNDSELNGVEVEDLNVVSDYVKGKTGKWAYLIMPNRLANISGTEDTLKGVTIPAGYAYLTSLGSCMKNNQNWLPVANSSRGGVSLGNSDLKMSKYHFDNNIIKDEQCTAFNGIVPIRPYGDVIWGDRTLLPLEDSVKASGYMSLMVMVCDISKEAYNAAVRYTYESNNDVTWLNYKTRLVKLLDQMVSAGVLQSYKIAKLASKTYNTIVCKISIRPNLPVENFDISIHMENAELTIEE